MVFTCNTQSNYIISANHECHEDSEISTDFDEQKDGTICMANRDFTKGEQFTIYYGQRSNADLLVHNGFVYSSSSGKNDGTSTKSGDKDSMMLRLGIARTDPLAQAKYDLLDQLSIPRSGGHFTISKEEKPFDNVLLAFLRILNMTTEEDINQWSNTNTQESEEEPSKENETVAPSEEKTNGSEYKFADKVRELLNDSLPSHPELDVKVYKYLETRCTLLLRSYPTTLEKDLENLKLEDDSEKQPGSHNLNQRNCTILRTQEKQILNHVLKYCQKSI